MGCKSSVSAFALASGLLWGTFSPSAIAQEAEEARRSLDVVVVTAERRAESIQDIPIAATAADEKVIRERGLSDPQDLTRIAPSVDIWSSLGESQPKITVRGVGSSNFEQTTESTAAIYLDEFPITPTSAKLPQFFDMERVEVLRGPQGTLYGKNTTGGAINLITRRPSGEPGGYGQITIGDYGQFDAEGAVETALSEAWAVRASIRRQYRDGYGTNLTTGEDIYDKDSLAGRAGLLYSGERAEMYFKVWGHQSRAKGFYTRSSPTIFDDGDTLTPAPTVPAHLVTGAVPNPDPYSEFFNDQKSDIDNWGLNANLDFDLDSHTLSFVAGFVDSEQDQDHDCDGSGFLLCQIDFIMDAEQFSGEARLTSDLRGAFNYIVGLNVFEEDVSLNNHYFSILFPGFTGAGESVSQTVDQKTTSFAVFADGTYQLTPALELLAGIRWTQDEKDYEFGAFFAPTPDPAALVIPFSDNETWDEFTYRIGLSWDAGENTNLYATYARGYRSGAYPGGFIPADFGPVDPEFVDSYELGLKSILLNDRLQLNAALFFMEFEDQQLLATLPGDISPALINAGQSEILGLEIEGQAILSDNFELGYSASFLDTEYQEFFRGPRSLAGQPLANAPDYKISLNPEFSWPVTGGDFFIASDITFYGEQRVGNDYDLLERDLQKAYELVDARIGWRGETIDAFVWGRNLTDEVVLRDWLDLSAFGFVQELYGEPISYGVTVSKRF